MDSNDFLKAKWQRMIDDDADLDNKYKKMDEMFNSEWKLPEGLNMPFIYPVKDSSPSDALLTAITTFSSRMPKPTLQPLSSHPNDKEKANIVEKSMMWQFHLADKRSETRLTPDGVRSALRYDKVCIEINHLPSHYDAIKVQYQNIEDATIRSEKLNAVERERKAALRKGDFLIKIRSPRSVHHRYNEGGLACVLLEQEMRAENIVATWGDAAKKHFDTRSEDWGDEIYVYYDYIDYEQRCVGFSGTNAGARNAIIIYKDVNPRPFIPWAIRVGGTSMDTDAVNRCIPFLNNVYQSGSWELVNMMHTIAASETLRYKFSPRLVTKTATGEGVEIDYTGENPAINLSLNEEAAPWAPPALDPAVMEMGDRARASIDAQTKVRVLMNPDFPAGTAFATINALLKTSLNGLMPWKELAEYAFADMYEIILLWVAYTERPILAQGTSEEDFGVSYMVQYSDAQKDFDPDYIHLTTELNADIPVDRVEQVNTAALLKNQLNYPTEEVMRQLGETDPQGLIRDRYIEDMVRNEVENMLLQSRAMVEMKLAAIQQMMQQAQAQSMQQAMQPPPSPQASMPPQAGQPGQMQAVPASPEVPAYENLGGPGFNPAMGGSPPAVGYPGGTREQLTGQTQGGEEVAI